MKIKNINMMVNADVEWVCLRIVHALNSLLNSIILPKNTAT